MRHRLRHRGVLPFAFAVLLTVAAGLSLAEEHGWEQDEAPAAGPQPAPTPHQLGPAAHRQAERLGVGSRALMGLDDVEPVMDPAMDPAADDVQPASRQQLQ